MVNIHEFGIYEFINVQFHGKLGKNNYGINLGNLKSPILRSKNEEILEKIFG